jgi:DNA-binding NarL/FixJ family response regulator
MLAKPMEQSDLAEGNTTDVGRWRVGLAVALFGAIAILMAVDLVEDSSTGADTAHLLLEGAVMLLAAAGVVALWRGLRTAQALAARLDTDLEAARIEAVRYKEEARQALQGLGQAIDSQFERWELTPAEREVGLLMLKGLSHREVAELRSTSEATVRQQALVIYRKSGLRNRSELSAFFLEDLLLPRSPV